MEKHSVKLIIKKEEHSAEVFATLEAMNGKCLWITSESYNTIQSLLKAIHYVARPDYIIIELPNLTQREHTNLRRKIMRIWTA